MRIASLAPFITELLHSLELDQSLVAISHACVSPKGGDALPRVSLPLTDAPQAVYWRAVPPLDLLIDVGGLNALAPDLILCAPQTTEPPILDILQQFAQQVGDSVKISAHAPRTLEQVYEEICRIAKACGVPAKGQALVQRMRAQFLDWGDSFYDRTKNKRVTVLSGIEPLTLAGLWVPDLVELASAVSHAPTDGKGDRPLEWREVIEFRPDVIIVAPREHDLDASLRTFKRLEKLPDWEAVPAVKRGEVIFCSGKDYLYRPSARLISSAAIVISAIAGFDSGYITQRDTFYRLRWLELQRHRF